MLASTINSSRSRQSLASRAHRRARDRVMARLSLEALEARWLPTGLPLVVGPNETIDAAHDLGTLVQPLELSGSIGNGPDGSADVTWYHFKLADSARVDLALEAPAGDPRFAGVLSLFNNDPQDYADPYDLDGHRLLAQVEANPSDGVADYVQDLGPGDYFVAISGAGNLDFSPLLAGSGYDGATGSYELTIRSTDLGISGDGPTVLSSDPADGADMDSSPLAIRLEMSGALDPNTVLPGQTVVLFAGTVAMVGDGTASQVALASVNFSDTADELQLFPLAPLEPGNYVVWLAGNSSTNPAVLADPNGVPLGEDAAHPGGADETVSFLVNGIDGVAGATGSDDTATTARNLGDLTGAGLVQVSAAIGDDPIFNPSLAPDPSNPGPQFVPANQVDLYHFEISGPGRYAMLAEVFAGRIGSPLDPGISLYELDPSTGSLVFVDGNDGTLDPAQGTDGSVPLFSDPALSDGLTAGNYYLAVAGGSNTPAPVEGQMPGSPGIFDPNQPGSAGLGWSTGSYVLNVLVQPADYPPRVVASSPSSGQILDQPPTQLTVQFSEAMNIQQLAFDAFQITTESALSHVFILGPGGIEDYPRFESYDRATNQATFLMLDGLANGSYTLHLSGSGGLTDLGGNALVGNNPGGDYVIPFQVQDSNRVITGNTIDGYTAVSTAGEGVPQDLGVLFPRELQAGVTVTRGPESDAGPGTTEDDYVIQILQNQQYFFTLSGDNLPAGAQVTVRDASGLSIPLLVSGDGDVFFGPLAAGTYTVAVGGWAAGKSATVSYQLNMILAGQQDNAPPLVNGPAPLLQIHLDGASSTAGTAPTDGSGGGSSGLSPVTLTGPASSGSGQNEAFSGLTSLAMSPLGGVASEAGPVPGQTVQVALGVPVSPVLSSLVSLVTLTQVMSLNHDGEGIQAVTPLEQPLAELSGGPPVVEQGVVVPGLPATLLPGAQAGLASNNPVPVVAESESGVVDAGNPVGAMAAGGSLIESPAVVVRSAMEPTSETGWMTRLVITGAAVAAAFRGRRVIQDVRWRKRVRAEQARSAGAACPHASRGGTTLNWRPGGMHHAGRHRIGSAVEQAGSLGSRNVR
jgi:methionine-rich copper-binding protein CopC